MKRIVLGFACVAVLAVTAALASLGWSMFMAQRADYGWRPSIQTPTHTASHPAVWIDEAHHNASTAAFTGRYWPFAKLLRADGYSVRRGRSSFSRKSLEGIDVLVIVNASGASKPQVFGVNLPFGARGVDRADSAFTSSEIEAVRAWVKEGGSLLLVADHAPFGESASGLGAAFGVTMHQGFTEIPNEVSDPLLYSDQNGRLGAHDIIAGPQGGAVRRVMTFTGQSLDGPAGATVLLRLPENAIEWVPAEGDSFVTRPAGGAQGIAFTFGKGRVVVLGEAAMLTAQVSRRVRFGMNTGDNDNERFALNVMRWLTWKV